jgi:PPK2 family polyphosphate:nucleotide phosphotransferase
VNLLQLSKINARAPKSVSKEKTQKKTNAIVDELDDLQNLLYAESKHSVLIILQGMDASGKDGLIRDVFGKMNPQGVRVTSFKQPTELEKAHDFLWRIHLQVPAKGMIQIFNRSHYEDVLVTRVYKSISDSQAMQRMRAINDFEKLLTQHNDTHILKFYLHISQEEQISRLEERIQDPQKQWKYNANDLKEAKQWSVYRKMYEDCFNNCKQPPWHIIPSDQNWYKEYLVANELHKLLKSLKMKYPGLKK